MISTAVRLRADFSNGGKCTVRERATCAPIKCLSFDIELNLFKNYPTSPLLFSNLLTPLVDLIFGRSLIKRRTLISPQKSHPTKLTCIERGIV